MTLTSRNPGVGFHLLTEDVNDDQETQHQVERDQHLHHLINHAPSLHQQDVGRDILAVDNVSHGRYGEIHGQNNWKEK